MIDFVKGELKEYCEYYAGLLNVASPVHADDFIFRFLINNKSFQDIKDAVRYYFSDGQKSSLLLKDTLKNRLSVDTDSQFSLLEFSSGYGCVSRHLQSILPNARIVACDIHRNAVEFIEEIIGIKSIMSHSEPDNLKLEDSYNIVFALSFFTHLPDHTWGRWLAKLYSLVAPGGFLLFTTHGRKCATFFDNPDIPESGYWFLAEDEQKAFPFTDYGQTITLPVYVINEVFQMTRAPIAFLKEEYWWGNQDTYALYKIP